MKKILFSLAANFMYAGILINVFSCNTLNGFTRVRLKTVEKSGPEYQSAPSLATTEIFRNEIPIRAARSFIHEFKLTDGAWRKEKDGGYVVDFIKDSIKTQVFYSYDGSQLYTVRTYAENEMPANMRKMIKDGFPDHTIAKVDEIIQPGWEYQKIYIVLIKNAINFKTLRICNMEMEITGSYNKT